MPGERLHWMVATLWVVATGCSGDPAPADEGPTGSTGSTGAPPATDSGSTSGETTTDVADTTVSPTTDGPSTGPDGTDTTTTGGPSGDGRARVIFGEGGALGQGVTQLTLVDYDSGTFVATPVHGPLRGDRTIVQWGVSQALQFVYFNAETEDDDEVFLVPYAEGSVGEPVRINVAPAPDPGHARAPSFTDDDDAAALYATDPEFGTNPGLWLVGLGGDDPDAPVAMHPPLGPGGSVALDVTIGPAAAGAVFRGDLAGTGVNNLYLTSSDRATTGTATQLSAHVDATQAVASTSVRWLPDGSAVVYRADADIDGLNELWWVGLEGGIPTAPLKVNDPLVEGQSLLSVRVAPDSRAVAYWAGQGILGDIFVAYLDEDTPSIPVLVSATGAGQAYASPLIWSPDGTALIYIGEHNTPGNEDAYYVDMSGPLPGTPDRINGQLLPGGGVFTAVFGPGDGYLYYVANQEIPAAELFRARLIDGSPGIPERISGALVGGGGLSGELVFSPDGGALLYTAQQDTLGVTELYMLELGEDVGEAVKINAELDEGFEVQFAARFSHDGSSIIYRIRDDVGEVLPLLLEDLTDGPGNPIVLGTFTQGSIVLPTR